MKFYYQNTFWVNVVNTPSYVLNHMLIRFILKKFFYERKEGLL